MSVKSFEFDSEAYDEGFEDGIRGVLLCERKNPYVKNSNEYNSWESNYHDGFSNGQNDSDGDYDSEEEV